MNRIILGFCLTVLSICTLCLVAQADSISIRYGGPALPQHGWTPAPWGDPANDGHNHNHNENVNLENVFDPTNGMFDAYASWFDDGTGMKFHPEGGDPGQNDPDYLGHGYIPADNPVLYQYAGNFLEYAPGAALGIVNGAFDFWESEINGTRGYRNPSAMIGFSWGRAPLGQSYNVSIQWYPQWNTGSEYYEDDNKNGRWDAGEYFRDADSDNLYDSVDKGRAWVTPAAAPILYFVEGWYEDGVWMPYFADFDATGVSDFAATVIHEAGHLVGLDDLYDLPGQYPNSTMGLLHVNPDVTKSRTIDIGSLQGGIDLYSIPVPEPSTLLLLGLGIGGVGFVARRKK